MVPALGAPGTALAPNKAGVPGGLTGAKAHAPRKITPTCTAQGATGTTAQGATAAASASSALLAAAAPGGFGTGFGIGFGTGFGAGDGAVGRLGGGSPVSPAISPTLARIFSGSRLLPAFPQPDGTPSALRPSAAWEATPSAGRASYGEVSAVERLQELQHAPFWRQQRELFGAVNALLEPLVQTVCTDATLALAQRLPSLGVRPGCLPPSQRALLQAALTEAHAHAGARLDTALRALLPRGAPSEVALHAASQLLPLVRLSISRLLPLRAASLLAKMPPDSAARSQSAVPNANPSTPALAVAPPVSRRELFSSGAETAPVTAPETAPETVPVSELEPVADAESPAGRGHVALGATGAAPTGAGDRGVQGDLGGGNAVAADYRAVSLAAATERACALLLPALKLWGPKRRRRRRGMWATGALET